MAENVFEAVKQSVSTREAAEFYGIKVRRNGMACCPFHDDKNPSMKVDQRFHCFGCGEDGDVIDFTAAVKVDALAVGIGNAHGLYKGRPNLDFQRLQEVRDVTDVPLVLHGGSGIPDDMIQTAIEIGIRKINVATEIRMAYVEGLLSGSANGDYYEMVKAGKASVKARAKSKIDLFLRK